MEKLIIKNKTKIDTLINNKKFISLFDVELFNFMLENSENEKESYTGLKKLYFMGIFTFEEYKNEFSENGYIKFYNKQRFVWPLEYSNYKKGASFRGKKRPQHSEHMKIKMKGIDRGDSFREKKKVQNKSINFKIKFLKNKNVSIDYDDHKLVKETYSKYISNVRKSPTYKINKVNNFINNNKYKGVDIYDNYVKKYINTDINIENFDKPFTEMMSIISIINIKSNVNMGTTKFFKKGEVKVKYCLNSKVITYRSSWELKTIKFLEDKAIKYKYEPFYLKKSDNTYYLPDFLLYLDDIILLEIKGFINGENGLKNEKLKIESAIDFCNEKGYKYCYLESKLINLKQIKDNFKN